MMRPDNAGPEVYLCRDPVDFRKGINGLAAMVEASMGHSPFVERLFVFCNRRRDRVKVLYTAVKAARCKPRGLWIAYDASGSGWYGASAPGPSSGFAGE